MVVINGIDLDDDDVLQEFDDMLALCSIVDKNDCQLVINKGFYNVYDFAQMSDEEIDNMARNMSNWCNEDQRLTIGAMVIKRMKTLAYHVRDLKQKGALFDPDEFTADFLVATMERMKTDTTTSKSDSDNLNPGSIDIKRWKGWLASF